MSTIAASPDSDISSRLIFLLSAPRSGSTLLMRILNATEQISSRSEPHLIPPLAHLGYWNCVDLAPYDQLQAQTAIREYLASLPQGDELYYKACRAYSDTLYSSMIEQGGTQYFLDKTPANSLVFPFLQKLYPKARFIILTRHPAAIFASYVESFFDGDVHAAHAFNPILSRYIPALAAGLEQPPEKLLHVSYEHLVQHPTEELQRISAFLDIPVQEQALEYNRASVDKGFGDPLGVAQNKRPVTSSLHRWVDLFHAQPHAKQILEQQLKHISDAELAWFGTSFASLWDAMAEKSQGSPKRKLNRFLWERRLLIALRKNIHTRPHGAWVQSIRRMCDILLRG